MLSLLPMCYGWFCRRVWIILLASAPVSFSKGFAHISRATFSGTTACLKHMASIHDSCLPLAGLEPPPLLFLEEWPWSCAGRRADRQFLPIGRRLRFFGRTWRNIQDRWCIVGNKSHTEDVLCSSMGSFFQQLSCVCTTSYGVWRGDSEI